MSAAEVFQALLELDLGTECVHQVEVVWSDEQGRLLHEEGLHVDARFGRQEFVARFWMRDAFPGSPVARAPSRWRIRVLVDGQDLHARGVDPVDLRRRVGMVFQRPNPFPTMSIADNVAAGLRLNGIPGNHDDLVEQSLRKAALWDEVKDRLHHGATSLSGGQQQRLCIARSLAVGPEVLLMDEPASALDPIATAKIEELIRELREQLTIVIVTHNMQQAARVSDSTAFFYMGELVEHGPTEQIFTNPRESRTEDYVTGKFG